MNYRAACARGISKVMAKMGISTLHSYKVGLAVGFCSDPGISKKKLGVQNLLSSGSWSQTQSSIVQIFY